MRADRLVPALSWLRRYTGADLGSDVVAAGIVTVMLIPQSLAYALLAGLPPEAGLYASILPLLAYALFGTSHALAVGPVAVISLMTAAAAGQAAQAGLASPAEAALALALLSGVMLLAMGVLRLGVVANFLSHPVISGFISASAILIATGQIGALLGFKVAGDTFPDMVAALARNLTATNAATALLGIAALALLWWARRGLKPLARRLGAGARLADLLAKAAPMLVVIAATVAVGLFGLKAQGVAVVGAIPAALPPLTLPPMDVALWRELAAPAALIALVGFVESVSVGQTLAARRRARIEPDNELVGLGTANLAAAFSGGFPVTGGFARSVVNADAGAATPLAGVFTAGGIAVAALLFAPLLADLPRAVLAATIIVAVLGLVDLHEVRRVWIYAKSDFAALAVTVLATLGVGVEAGIASGVALSLLLHLWRTSRPHIAVVGQVPGSEHFRNVDRHAVLTDPAILSLRVDESLYFANARYLEQEVMAHVAARPDLRHVVLMCTAVNAIDASALESLEGIQRRLHEADIAFHLSEVKGPVMDRLLRTDFLRHLTGRVFLSQYEAFKTLRSDTISVPEERPA